MASKAEVAEIIEKMKALGLTRGVGTAQHRERFGSEREEQVFRAVAANYPKAVVVAHDTSKAWKKAADGLVKAGSLRTVIVTAGTAYNLTPAGKRRAISEKILADDMR